MAEVSIALQEDNSMAQQTNLGDVLSSRHDEATIALIDLTSPETPVNVSYAALHRLANRYAHYLSHLKLDAGSSVAILGVNSRAYLAAYMGILRAGLVVVPINVKQPTSMVDYVFADANVQFALTGSDQSDLVPQGVSSIDLWSPDILECDSDDNFTVIQPADNDTAEILYTSGSTGRPKGVVLSHRSQIEMLRATGSTGRKPPFKKRCGLVAAPLFHMNALMFSAAILASDGTVVLLPKFETALFMWAIKEYQVQLITGVPTMIAMFYQLIQDSGGSQFPSVETVYIGSAPVTNAIIRQAHELFPAAEVINSYGTTETGGGLFGTHPRGIERPERSVGYPLPHAEVRLQNQDENNCGVLEVRSSSNMTGYLNLPELTVEKILDGWINTGDKFRFDENGFYFYIGRADDMFVCSGENIYPGELETLIEKLDSVVQVSVIPIDDHRRGQIPAAFVVTEKDDQVSEQDVKEFVLSNAPAYMHPRHVFFLKELPLAATSKVDKKRLRAITEERLAN